MGFLSGKRALIVGLATDRSIAWGIAQAMHAQGAELAFAHIERMTDRVVPLAKQLGSDITFVMDVASDEEIAQGFAQLKSRWDAFDILVHAVAFAPREALTGGFLDATTREGFRVAHDISSYSFTALARASLPFMQGRAGSMVSLSYLGAVRSIPGYNVMGLAKASLEANVRFLAADLGAAGHPRQRHFRRTHQDAVRGRHSGPAQDARARGGHRAHPAQRDHRGRRQRGGLPVFGARRRHQRRGAVCGRRIPQRGHEFSLGQRRRLNARYACQPTVEINVTVKSCCGMAEERGCSYVK